jgi:spermidine/putrescine transport system permease protein
MRGRILAWVFVIGPILVFMLGPMALVVIFSFSANPLISFPVRGLTFDWYRALFLNREFWNALQNSLIVAGAVGAISTFTGTMAAFGLIRFEVRVKGPVLTWLSLPVMLPPLLLAVALVVFYVRMLQLPLTLATVIGGHVLITQPFVILILLARIANIDHASIDAARDLGASRWQAFMKITLPQIRAALIGAALVTVAISLDDFIIAVFTIGSGNTLSTFVWGKVRTTLDPSINAIASILLALTISVTVLALQLTRYRG